MKKAQVALELIVSIAFLILVLIVVSAMALEKNIESRELKTLLDVKRVGVSLKDNIDMISQQGHGYYKYFSIPETVHGDYDYNVTVSNNILEITWADKVWSTQLNTPDVVIYSLDKGGNRLNRVMDRGGVIEITGDRPNLKPLCDSIRLSSDGFLLNVSFDVVNDAHVGDGVSTTTALTQVVGGTSYGLKTVLTSPIPAYGKTTVSLNDTDHGAGQTTFIVGVDYSGDVLEGIESDNECNLTVVR